MTDELKKMLEEKRALSQKIICAKLNFDKRISEDYDDPRYVMPVELRLLGAQIDAMCSYSRILSIRIDMAKDAEGIYNDVADSKNIVFEH